MIEPNSDDWIILHNTSSGLKRRSTPTGEIREAAAHIGDRCRIAVEPFDTAAGLLARLDRLLALGHKQIAVAGGDGTVAAAAARLALRPACLGIVPTGGANNFARALHIPTNLEGALRTLASGHTRQVSLGLARAEGGGRFFTETAGVGLFADGLALYGKADENTAWGIWTLLRLFVGLHPRRLRLTLDGQTQEIDAVMCAVANSPRFSDSLPVAPGARLSDDVFDVVLFGNLHRRELLRTFRALRRGRHLRELPEVTRYRAREVTIQAAEGEAPLTVHADDAIIGHTPAVFTLQAGALCVAVPSSPR